MKRIVFVSRRCGKRRMMLEELWANLEKQYALCLAEPGRMAPGLGLNPALVAAKMCKAVRESFGKGERTDWLSSNPALAVAVKTCFGYTTTKQWREAWAHLT